MTAAVLSMSSNATDFGKTIFAKITRWFMVVSYSRAIGELTRLGLDEEARNLTKDLKAL